MKNVLKKGAALAVIVLMFLVVTSFNIVNAETIDAPHIEFKAYDHAFGKVLQRAKLKHTFTFKNTGSRKLIIEKVKAG